MVNQEICNDILRYGKVISDTEFNKEDGWYRQYIVECDGDTYYMAKHNGVWVFIRRGV